MHLHKFLTTALTAVMVLSGPLSAHSEPTPTPPNFASYKNRIASPDYLDLEQVYSKTQAMAPSRLSPAVSTSLSQIIARDHELVMPKLGDDFLTNLEAVKTKTVPITQAPASTVAEPQDCPRDYKALVEESYKLIIAANEKTKNKDDAGFMAMAPDVDALVARLPQEEITPEVCKTHIIAFTDAQYFEIKLLRSKNIDPGFPNLDVIKIPDLPFIGVFVMDSDIHFKRNEIEASQNSLLHGLIAYPHNILLAEEYTSTLILADRNTEALGFGTEYFSNNPDMRDSERAQILVPIAISLIKLGHPTEAEAALILAYAYDSKNEQVLGLLSAIIKAKTKPVS